MPSILEQLALTNTSRFEEICEEANFHKQLPHTPSAVPQTELKKWGLHPSPPFELPVIAETLTAATSISTPYTARPRRAVAVAHEEDPFSEELFHFHMLPAASGSHVRVGIADRISGALRARSTDESMFPSDLEEFYHTPKKARSSLFP
eukprot:CAMPEP_0179894432 /NCGR_PEP_ID=MMETSP0982-20121206/35282_1 /TAXON_ID=483367 /ORGANISM="non described non described, Strain CCMP 2436" /LENGTH=148 /DNA_ID=CAMNT_0021791021 /DNA_START=10 /DNA_END=456 /DNA_ORIENTATION=+